MNRPAEPLPKLETGIPGFDFITEGGFPLHRSTLVAGTAGSAKTIFACQFLAVGRRAVDETGGLRHLRGGRADIRRNVRSLGWDIEPWEAEAGGASSTHHRSRTRRTVIGRFDFGALIARVERAVTTHRREARRARLDRRDLHPVPRPAVVRDELYRLVRRSKAMGVTR